MRKPELSTNLLIVGLVFSISLFGGMWTVAKGLENRSARGITVTGSAEISATADVAVWNISLNVQLPTIAQTIKQLKQDRTDLIAFLAENGISEDEITLGGISTYRVYEYVNGYETGQILAYDGDTNVKVRTANLDNVIAANATIDSLMLTGVNAYVEAPQFYLSNLKELRPEVIQAAVEDAKVRAEAMVAGIGGSIGDPLSASTGSVEVNPPDVIEGEYGAYDTSTVEKSVRAVVKVTFAIE